MVWEHYWLTDIPAKRKGEKFTAALDALSEEGWEIAGVTGDPNGVVGVLLRRPVEG